MKKGVKKRKGRITRGDIFINRATGGLVRVMSASKDHQHFGDMKGTITARPFTQHGNDDETPSAFSPFDLRADKSHDFEMLEREHLYVRPSSITVLRGALSKTSSLRVRVDVGHCQQIEQLLEDPKQIYVDSASSLPSTANLEAVLSKIPMFVDELPLVEQAMVGYGNSIEASPIVHPEIAGRGVEYAHGRAAWFYGNRCNGKLADMETNCRKAYGIKNIPPHLGAKFERRTRDYQRSYRMGVRSVDLEKCEKI